MIAYTNYLSDARVMKEAEAAVQAGFNVDFLSLRKESEYKREIINNVQVYRLNQQRYRGGNSIYYILSYLEFFLRCFLKQTYLFFKHKYRIVHVNNMPDFLVFSALIPKLLGAKIILDIHDPMPLIYSTKFQRGKNKLLYKILILQERFSAKFCDHVITVHDPIKNEILIKDGIPERKISVIANFADADVFKLNREYMINKKIKLVFYGTIAERFGLEVAIKAIAGIQDRNNIFLKIIGEGDFSESLKRIIKKYHIENSVDFENKVYPYTELPNILKGFHLGLVSYKLSTATDYMLPVKMMELLAMGIPVITIANRAIIYYFRQDECFYYNPDSDQSLADLLKYLIQNSDQILKRRKNILKIRNRYLWSDERKKYIDILYQLSNLNDWSNDEKN
jgi:glycosyltransferase involved in cell wall biosynthesis